eukprot:TRINITY_DN12359_c0_g1_i1.p2 TRINITY_DN12359_c0_g1~~TRINITY_DN12359_c0_g1_i1.p2  ORF type:complete len:139 (-),score=17.59 TRINITY_DN12359_c0_g1_i1:86-502(-)
MLLYSLVSNSFNSSFENTVFSITDPNSMGSAGTTSIKEDYLEICFEGEVEICSFVVAATNVGGVDESRLNGALFQGFDGNDWRTLVIIGGVVGIHNKKSFTVDTEFRSKRYRLLHGSNITSDKCLALAHWVVYGIPCQ